LLASAHAATLRMLGQLLAAGPHRCIKELYVVKTTALHAGESRQEAEQARRRGSNCKRGANLA
jgi:hypothetical protein